MTPAQRVTEAVDFYYREHGRAAGFMELARRTRLFNNELSAILRVMAADGRIVAVYDGGGGRYSPPLLGGGIAASREMGCADG